MAAEIAPDVLGAPDRGQASMRPRRMAAEIWFTPAASARGRGLQ